MSWPLSLISFSDSPRRRNAVLRQVIFLLAVLFASFAVTLPAQESVEKSSDDIPAIFKRENLFAWCVVPFDSKARGPEARADMLTRLGIFGLAYDWRAEHIPTFDEEMETLKQFGRIIGWITPVQGHPKFRFDLVPFK